MASARNRSIIIIDDDIVEAKDVEFLGCASFYSSEHPQVTKSKPIPANPPHQTPCARQNDQNLQSQDRTTGSDLSDPSTFSTFQSFDWGSRAPRLANSTLDPPATPSQASQPLQSGSKPRKHWKPVVNTLSPSSESWTRNSMLGSADEIIYLGEDHGRIGERGVEEASAAKRRSRCNGTYSLFPRQEATECQKSIFLDDDRNTDSLGGEERPIALARSLTRHPTTDDELTDLESIEDHLLRNGQTLQFGDIYLRDAQNRDNGRPIKLVKNDYRNPSIVLPFRRWESLQHLGSTLVQNNTVELRNGGFLHIKDIICNTQTTEIKLRGHRLQRARDMNGMLEKKVNEVLLFFEVDLDDPRDLLEQAAVEIPLAEVARVRDIRFTNERFPLHRNTDPSRCTSKDEALEGGGLTARWKYTCTYASATDRHHNLFKERALERVRATECTEQFSVPESERRYRWRGKTIAGGAYQPSLRGEEDVFLAEIRGGRPISISSSPEPDDFALVHVHSIDDSSSDDEEVFRNSSVMATNTPPKIAKRKYSKLVSSSKVQTTSHKQREKKMRHSEDKFVKETRDGMARMDLQPVPDVIDVSDSDSASTPPSFPRTIDLTYSELSTPPDSGSIRTKPLFPVPPVVRTAGQKLTYGDAFCGAGGATRGAVMAGLHILWGFDFWKQGCESWRVNFPYATCYNKPAHKFVEMAKRSEERGCPDLMKVDILHLSPPCQFFSPAHTINGVDDEMNTASLFAVQTVIEVSKARAVTLEQTFGIACPRFKFYFNSLIQMFTAHDFSVRWAIIPLAQWGLPQRRNRLIIIASCPGEILPKMPLATHSETGQPPLKPYISVQSALSTIPRPSPFSRPDPLHRPSSVAFAPNKYLTPWDASKILPRAMTCSGGQNYHPSGKRDFTLREYATLQGFPTCHVFKGSYVKKQIGNAMPPCAAKVLFESIKKDLDDADGVEEAPFFIE